MSHDPHAQIDQTVLDMIEQSPTGAVPHTPTYQDALRRLYTTHQAYPSADHKDGHVTARSLSKRAPFYPDNVDALVAGRITASELEANTSVFNRYLQSLPEELRAKAESHRLKVVGRPVLHRKHHGLGDASGIHDPVHSLFLVPGSGPQPGLPGNYLYGALIEVVRPDADAIWVVQLHDCGDAMATSAPAPLAETLGMLQDVLASAPFHLVELEALGLKMN